MNTPLPGLISFSRGFSLIELMIALLMAGLLTVVMGNVFIANQVARNAAEALSEIQNNGRVGMMWFKYDLRMAGNTASTFSRAPVAVTEVGAMEPTVNGNCFTDATQAFDWGLALLPLATGEAVPLVYGVDNVTTANTVFTGCIDGANLQPGSDILSLHYTGADPIADADLVNGNIYVDSGLGGMVMFQCTAAGDVCKGNLTDAREDPSGSTTREVFSRLYYVRSWADEAGDGTPTLMRVSLQGSNKDKGQKDCP